MRTVIIYSSNTGNTKKVAMAIKEVLPRGTEIYSIEKAPDPDNYDLILMGYWVDKGNADIKTRGYINKISAKTIGLFGTLGANPTSDHALIVKKRVEQPIEKKNRLIFHLLCQGKIYEEALNKYNKMLEEDPSNAGTKAYIENFYKALNRPDKKDLEYIKNEVRKKLNNMDLLQT